MGTAATVRSAYARLRERTTAYVANADPLAAAANTGALLVWGSQPTYPLYVYALVGRHFWPALLTWASTPFFFAAPLLARRSSVAGRALFCGAGLANTLLATKAFGTGTAVGWFMIPCLVIAAGFFRATEWRWAAGLVGATLASALALPHLAPTLVTYTPAEQTSLTHLNLWSALVLTVYLTLGAWRARRLVEAAA